MRRHGAGRQVLTAVLKRVEHALLGSVLQQILFEDAVWRKRLLPSLTAQDRTGAESRKRTLLVPPGEEVQGDRRDGTKGGDATDILDIVARHGIKHKSLGVP
jgi:hypothetical protein